MASLWDAAALVKVLSTQVICTLISQDTPLVFGYDTGHCECPTLLMMRPDQGGTSARAVSRPMTAGLQIGQQTPPGPLSDL
jgi:hypothetical protein